MALGLLARDSDRHPQCSTAVARLRRLGSFSSSTLWSEVGVLWECEALYPSPAEMNSLDIEEDQILVQYGALR